MAETSDVSANLLRPTAPGTKRLLLTLSLLFSFLLGLPFLIKSTAIYRAPLPFNSIESLANELKSHPPSLPIRFQAVFLQPIVHRNGTEIAENLLESVSKRLRRISGEFAGNYTLSVVVDSGDACFSSGSADERWECGVAGSHPLIGEDDEVDQRLDLLLRGGEAGGRVYTVLVGDEGDGRVVVGKYRHAWINGGVSEDRAIEILGNIFVKLFMNGGKMEESGQGKGDYMPVGSDGSLVLSFSLLNANPEDWVYDWNFGEVGEKFLAPVVEALSPIASITVESQVLYHSPKASKSSWDEELGIYSFSTDDLPFFVNSNEWHLDTSAGAAGRSKLVHFVVYIPSLEECPLHLQLPNGMISETNGFISPMWGGVVVWNPPSCSNRSVSPLHAQISSKDLERLFQVFMGQFRLLFGIRSQEARADLGISRLLTSKKGFAAWELDFLFRQHACFNLLSCATTLDSLSKLVQSLPRMIVKEEIGKQVSLSLEAADSATKKASAGFYSASAALSKRARELAEDAFFHSSIMSISYSSLEHYFAIYMPFFAPVSLHVVLAALKEVKRYRVERAKHAIRNS